MMILPVFSEFLWNLKFIFLGARKKFVFGVIKDN